MLAIRSQPSNGRFVRTGRGMWKYEIPFEDAAEAIELDIEAVWNGLELRNVDEFEDTDGTKLSRGSYVGHNADLAEGLQLAKVDAGVYEVTVPSAMLPGFRTTQLQPASWAE